MRRLQVLVSLAAALASVLVGVGAAPARAAASPAVVGLGDAAELGSPPSSLQAPLVDIASHPSASGYWVVGGDGGIFSFGDARFHGSTGAITLARPVVGMAPTPTGNGYWLVAEDGGIFAFGDARFHGSTGAITLARPVVGMAPTPTGNGYWLVAEDGGVFAFGDARFHGSTGGLWIGTTIVGIAPTPSGRGYSLAGADGQVFAFGDAPLVGAARLALAAPITGIEASPSGRGLWLVAEDGAVFSYGDARFHGGVNPFPVAAVGIARTPGGGGYWMAVNPPESNAPPGSGSGRRIVYSNSAQRIWLVETSGRVAHSWLVSGRRGAPAPGTYHVFSKSPVSWSGSLRLNWMTRFTVARSGKAIGFHGIPLRPDGSPVQSDAELGQYRSAGCVRMNQDAVKVLYDWAPIGTPVVVLP